VKIMQHHIFVVTHIVCCVTKSVAHCF